MDALGYLFYRLGQCILQVWSIPVVAFGYEIKFGSIVIWCMIASLVIKFIKDMAE